MSSIELQRWESRIRAHLASIANAGADAGSSDPAHDLAHLDRVARAARRLAAEEGAALEAVLPAAWMHDLVNVPKSDPRRSQASRLSAAAATALLAEWGYPREWLDGIAHAIEAHSFTAAIEPRTPEARVVQDADRLDALGAIGIARVFSTAQRMESRYYDPADPWARGRPLDDRANAIDHFEVKLFKVAASLKTAAGRAEGERRIEFMRSFLRQLSSEIGGELGGR